MNRKSSRPIHSTPSLIGWGRPAVTFRRFCRKGYAVFVSLHREVRIGVLTVGMLASVHLPKVQAMMPTMGPDTEGEADDTELSEVTVAGTLSPLTALQSARIVGVITCQQIEASAAQSVNDLLKLAVGVDVRQRGGFGIQSDISIDGGTFDQITLLLNGVNISSPHTGHLAADFPVSLSDIERIEILEGAASRVYGASAFGGAINIVTKGEDRPTPIPGQSPPTRSLSRQGGACWSNDSLSQARGISSLTGGVQGGSYTTFGADVRVSLRQPLPSLTEGVGSGAVSAQYLRSDGATFNSDFRRGSAYLRGILDAEDFRIDLQAGYSEKAYGANTFYSAAYPNQWEHNRRFIFSAGIETKGRIRVRPEVYWNRLYDHFQLIRSTPTGENFHRSDVYGTRVTAGLSWVAGRTTIGAEVREEGIYSSNLGKPLNENRSSHYTHHDARTNLSLSAEHTLLLSRFTASAGLLAHYNARFDSHLRLYPGIDLAYTPPTSNHSSPSMESTVQSSSQGEAVKPGAKSKVLRRTKRQSRAQSPKLFAERSGKAERKAQSSKFKVQSSKFKVLRPHWLVRSTSEQLAQAINTWWHDDYRQRFLAAEQARLKPAARVRRHVRPPMLSRQKGIISSYDQLFQRHAATVGWDWRLMAAQCYQESGFDPKAVSWAGAQGLMQIMPATAQHLGLPRNQAYDPEQNIAAAARYLRELNATFADISDRHERINFVLAAYNGGVGHVRDAMTLARKYGHNPQRWAEVDIYILALAQPRYYRDPAVRCGYLRGTETSDYVRQIHARWAAYRGAAHASKSVMPSGNSQPSRIRPRSDFQLTDTATSFSW